MYPAIIHLAAGVYFSGDALFVALCVGFVFGIGVMTTFPRGGSPRHQRRKDGGRVR